MKPSKLMQLLNQPYKKMQFIHQNTMLLVIFVIFSTTNLNANEGSHESYTQNFDTSNTANTVKNDPVQDSTFQTLTINDDSLDREKNNLEFAKRREEFYKNKNTVPKNANKLAEFANTAVAPQYKFKKILPNQINENSDETLTGLTASERQALQKKVLSNFNKSPQEMVFDNTQTENILNVQSVYPNNIDSIDPIEKESQFDESIIEQRILNSQNQNFNSSITTTQNEEIKPNLYTTFDTHTEPKQNEKSKNTKKRKSTYRVRSGDTMIGVAVKFGMSASKLAKINGMQALDDLRIGQKLTLVANKKFLHTAKKPVAEKVALKKKEKTVKIKRTVYRVTSGDTMIGVAGKFRMSASKLAKMNGMKALSSLRIGQNLKLTGKAHSSKKSDSKKQIAKKKSIKPKLVKYRVKRGDGLIQLARKSGISVQKLAKINKLKKTSELKIGQVITLPRN